MQALQAEGVRRLLRACLPGPSPGHRNKKKEQMMMDDDERAFESERVYDGLGCILGRTGLLD
jgi:hypothetical protein